jgi:Flp pilus assembly protein TadD
VKNTAEHVDLAALAVAHKANPTDPVAALAYARALRAAGARAQALAVLDKASAANQGRRQLLFERGLLALELGQAEKAEALLRKAYDPKMRDWRIHSALGTALASRGKQQEAQVQFAKALALAPDHPIVLNNLALSYALDGKPDEAETLLRRAQRSGSQSLQIRQNLALVLALRGKYDEAKTVAESALPADKAAQNLAYLKTLADARATAGAEPAKSAAATEQPSERVAATTTPPQPAYRLGGSHRD